MVSKCALKLCTFALSSCVGRISLYLISLHENTRVRTWSLLSGNFKETEIVGFALDERFKQLEQFAHFSLSLSFLLNRQHSSSLFSHWHCRVSLWMLRNIQQCLDSGIFIEQWSPAGKTDKTCSFIDGDLYCCRDMSSLRKNSDAKNTSNYHLRIYLLYDWCNGNLSYATRSQKEMMVFLVQPLQWSWDVL